jgi:FlaG/FlaF family flagellin (archaellin)
LKREVSPTAAIALVVAILVVAGGLIYFRGGGVSRTNEKPPGMPPEAAAKMQDVMKGASGTTAPPAGRNGPGMPGGYLAPPSPH